MTVDNLEDLYPAHFPDNVPVAKLEKISLKNLLSGDEDEQQRMFNVCTGTGFFYLEMDHEKGEGMWQDACVAARAGKQVFPNVPIAEKKKFKAPVGIKVLERGYQCGSVNEDGIPRDSEMFMIPQHELLSEKSDFVLPEYLQPHEESFKNALISGNEMANIVLSVLEKKLGLAPGTFTRLHRLTDSSGDFLRVLRYPGSNIVERVDPLRFPAHKDAVSIAILFTWVGGLQIVAPEAAHGINPFMIPDENWRWIKPLPNTAVVNLGDAMEVFTNGLLKSGLHRVIKAPGEQAAHDKYSVLVVARPEESTPMKAFTSSVIPELTPEQAQEPVYTSIEWGHNKIKALQDFIDKLQSTRAGKQDNLQRSW